MATMPLLSRPRSVVCSRPFLPSLHFVFLPKHRTASKKVKHSNAGYYCCVLCCRNRSSSDQSLHFHRFPSQKGRRPLRLRAIRREVGRNFAITSNTRVCSAHFKPTDYFRSNEGIVSRLQPGAVPTEFSWSPRKTPTPRRVLVRELPVSKKVRLTSCDSEGDGDGDVFSFNVAIVTPLPSADHDYCITSVAEAVRGADSCALFHLQRKHFNSGACFRPCIKVVNHRGSQRRRKQVQALYWPS